MLPCRSRFFAHPTTPFHQGWHAVSFPAAAVRDRSELAPLAGEVKGDPARNPPVTLTRHRYSSQESDEWCIYTAFSCGSWEDSNNRSMESNAVRKGKYRYELVKDGEAARGESFMDVGGLHDPQGGCTS